MGAHVRGREGGRTSPCYLGALSFLIPFGVFVACLQKGRKEERKEGRAGWNMIETSATDRPTDRARGSDMMHLNILLGSERHHPSTQPAAAAMKEDTSINAPERERGEREERERERHQHNEYQIHILRQTQTASWVANLRHLGSSRGNFLAKCLSVAIATARAQNNR